MSTLDNDTLRTTHVFRVCTITHLTGDDVTYTARHLVDGGVSRDASSKSDTTPTAAQIVTEVKNKVSNIAAGTSFDVVISNQNTGIINLSGGTGVTTYGDSTISGNQTCLVRVVCSNVTPSSESVEMYMSGN